MRHFLMGLVGAWSLVCLCSGAWAWQVTINGSADRADIANAVTVDAAGNVIAVGWTDNKGTINDFTVIKLAGESGAELWRYGLNGTRAISNDIANAVTVDAAGDVLVAGVLDNSGTRGDLTVMKLAGSSGAELWRAVINGTANEFDVANAIAVDATGDVLAAGWTSHTSPRLLPRHEASFTVVKLRGIDGEGF